MKDFHAFEARRISHTNIKLNFVMSDIFQTIKTNAGLGMYYAVFVGIFDNLTKEEQEKCIQRLKGLSYNVTKTTTGIEVQWN